MKNKIFSYLLFCCNSKSKSINSKFGLILILSLFLSSLSFAQNQKKIDSLKNAIRICKYDTSKIMLYHKLGMELENNKTDNAEKYYMEGLSLAKKTNFKKGIALHLGDLGRLSHYNGKNKESINYLEESLEHYKLLKDEVGIALIYDNIGIANFNLGNYDLALDQRKKGIDIYKKLELTDKIGGGYQWIGNVYLQQRDLNLALEFFLKAAKVFEKKKDEDYGNATASLATIYRHQKQFTKAKALLSEVIPIYEKTNNLRVVAIIYQNLGNIEYDQLNFDEALIYYLKSLKIREDIKDMNGIVSMYNSIGLMYAKKDKFTEAETYYNKGLEIAEKNGYKALQSVILVNLTSVAGKINNLTGALEYAQKALKIGKELKAKDVISGGYFLVSSAYSNMDDNKKALNYFKLYKIMEDSIKNDKYSKSTLELQTVYETEKKDKSIAELNIKNLQKEKANLLLQTSLLTEKKDKAIAELNYNNSEKEKENIELQATLDTEKKDKKITELNIKNLEEQQAKQQREIWLGIAGALLIIGLLSFYIWRKRKTYQFGQELTEVKQEALNAQMSDHFISNSMDSINSFMEDNDKKMASQYLLTFNRLIRKVLENSFQKRIPIKEDLAILNDYLALEKLRFEGELVCETNIDKSINTETTLIPPMIFQVLIENSIKHGFSKEQGGKIILSLNKKADWIECTVDDNGIGRKLKSTPTQRTSFGTAIAEKLIKFSNENAANNSFEIVDLNDSANKPIGTRVIFKIPYITA